MKKLMSTSYVSVSLALGRDRREPDSVITVVINSILATNPSKTTPLERIEVLKFLLVPPTLALSAAELGFNRRLTAVDMEALVGGDERGLRPVGLLQATPRGPVVRVP